MFYGCIWLEVEAIFEWKSSIIILYNTFVWILILHSPHALPFCCLFFIPYFLFYGILLYSPNPPAPLLLARQTFSYRLKVAPEPAGVGPNLTGTSPLGTSLPINFSIDMNFQIPFGLISVYATYRLIQPVRSPMRWCNPPVVRNVDRRSMARRDIDTPAKDLRGHRYR